MVHKYYKREGTPGNYKYYYTEAEYKQAKGRGSDKKMVGEKKQEGGELEKLKSDLKNIESSGIISAVNSYKHNEDTLNQLSKKIDVLSKMEKIYDKDIDSMELKRDSDWEKRSELRKKHQNIKNALVSYQIAYSASDILQKNGVEKRMGILDVDNTLSIFSNVRTLINQARSYEDDVLKGVSSSSKDNDSTEKSLEPDIIKALEMDQDIKPTNRQEIYKQLDDLIEKARSGVYSNTYENRKKGRVG